MTGFEALSPNIHLLPLGDIDEHAEQISLRVVEPAKRDGQRSAERLPAHFTQWAVQGIASRRSAEIVPPQPSQIP